MSEAMRNTVRLDKNDLAYIPAIFNLTRGLEPSERLERFKEVDSVLDMIRPMYVEWHARWATRILAFGLGMLAMHAVYRIAA